ncbi:hypothetical protein NGGBJF_28105 [Cupriavidus necator]
MKVSLCNRLLPVALIVASATVAYAGERPRENGVACARAANAYCNLPDQGNRPMPQGVPQGESA